MVGRGQAWPGGAGSRARDTSARGSSCPVSVPRGGCSSGSSPRPPAAGQQRRHGHGGAVGRPLGAGGVAMVEQQGSRLGLGSTSPPFPGLFSSGSLLSPLLQRTPGLHPWGDLWWDRAPHSLGLVPQCLGLWQASCPLLAWLGGEGVSAGALWLLGQPACVLSPPLLGPCTLVALSCPPRGSAAAQWVQRRDRSPSTSPTPAPHPLLRGNSRLSAG